MSMLKTLLKEVKEYKRVSIVTPVFMIVEVLMETLIPFLMASIIDEGVNAGNMQHIYKVGGIMVVACRSRIICRTGRRKVWSKGFCRICKKSA